MSEAPLALAPFLSKLEGHARLTAADRQAVLALPHTIRRLAPGDHLFREGDRATSCIVMLSGFACRHKIVGEGARQLLSVHMKGDGIDLLDALLGSTDHGVQSLGPAEAAVIPAAAISDLILSHPAAGRTILIETVLDASIQREWTANVGRRDARTRIAHVLCELGVRMEAAGVGRRDRFDLPLTQEQLADVTGLTIVHVNRVLQGLRAAGLISRGKRPMKVADWQSLADAGDFREDYLRTSARSTGKRSAWDLGFEARPDQRLAQGASLRS